MKVQTSYIPGSMRAFAGFPRLSTGSMKGFSEPDFSESCVPEFRVQGFGFGVLGLGLGFRAYSAGFRVHPYLDP